MSEYRILPPVIERSGFLHKLIERNGMVCIYETYNQREPDILLAKKGMVMDDAQDLSLLLRQHDQGVDVFPIRQ